MEAYTDNQVSSTSIVMESSPVARSIVQFMTNHKDGWTGRISDLHTALLEYEIYKDAKAAPKAPNKLSGHLRRIRSAVRVQGIDIQEARKTKTGAEVSLKWILLGDDKVTIKPKGDDKHPLGDDKNKVSSPLTSPHFKPTDTEKGQFGDDSDDTLSSPSAFYPPLDEEEEKQKESESGRADEVGNLSSVSSPVNDAILPDDATTPEPDYDAAYQLLSELTEAGAWIEWLPDGRSLLVSQSQSQWNRKDWRRRITVLDRELRELCH